MNYLGDPCPGTYKYLEVEYECKEGKVGQTFLQRL